MRIACETNIKTMGWKVFYLMCNRKLKSREYGGKSMMEIALMCSFYHNLLRY